MKLPNTNDSFSNLKIYLEIGLIFIYINMELYLTNERQLLLNS